MASTIPIIPKKWPNTSNPKIIVIGLNFVVLLIINGWNKFPSNAWTTAINIKTAIPIGVPCEKATKTAGAPPIYGPAYGITFVIPQNNPNNNGAFNPIIANPINDIINTTLQSIIAPITNLFNGSSTTLTNV